MLQNGNRSQVVLRVLIMLALLVALPALTTAQRRGGGGGNQGGGGRNGAQRGPQNRGNNQNRGNRSNPQNSGNNQAIVINKVDGSVLKVELISFDVDHLQVRNPGERGDFVPIDVSWNDVVKTSLANVTYQKVLDQWKVAHRNELCPTCKGDRTVLCDVCRGTYHDPSELPKDCPTCGGSLMTLCKGPKDTNGKIPCTNVNCLKLTDGKWTDREGGKARSFNYAGGVAWVSDKHLGHVISVDQKTGAIKDDGICPVCNGATILDCPVCDGLGMVPCQTCSQRKVALCSSDCEKGHTICPTCSGNGLKRTAVAMTPENPTLSRISLAMLSTQRPAAGSTPVAGELMHSVDE